MREYAFFPGCSIPSGFPEYEKLVLLILEEFGITVQYIDGLTCCPAPMSFDVREETMYYTTGARNLSLIESKGLDVISPCNGCTMTLSRVNKAMKQDEVLKKQINGYLETIDRRYNGTVNVYSLLRVLYETIGTDKVKAKVQKPLEGIKVAVHYGCHAYEELDEYNDAQNPTALEELCMALGADVVDYKSSGECCLVFANSVDRDYVFKSIQSKMQEILDAGAECLVVICASCFSQYDNSAEVLGWLDMLDEESLIPIFLYPELLALSMELDISELGLGQHKIDPHGIVDRIKNGV